MKSEIRVKSVRHVWRARVKSRATAATWTCMETIALHTLHTVSRLMFHVNFSC